MNLEYKKRIADKYLEQKLRVFGGVLITGPKGCGKSTTAKQKAKTIHYLGEPTLKEYYDQIFNVNPKQVLDGS